MKNLSNRLGAGNNSAKPINENKNAPDGVGLNEVAFALYFKKNPGELMDEWPEYIDDRPADGKEAEAWVNYALELEKKKKVRFVGHLNYTMEFESELSGSAFLFIPVEAVYGENDDGETDGYLFEYVKSAF